MTDSVCKLPTLAILCALCLPLGFWNAGAFAAGNQPAPAEGAPPPPAGEPKPQPPAASPDAKADTKAPEGADHPTGTAEANKKTPTTLTCPAPPETVKAVQEAAAAALKTPVRVANSIGMDLLLIPAGEFTMGSPETEKWRKWDEGPTQRVQIKTAFYLADCEVTQAQYEKVMGTNPATFRKPENPVECVSWKDAMEFCKRLSAKEGKTYRLPTEAEWEYACRAGSETRYWWGESEHESGKYTNVRDMADRSPHPGLTTSPVGTFKPNAFGLHDMIGNVWDWCQSLEKAYPYRADDGREDLTAAGHRIVRGGSWRSYRDYCRSAARYALDPSIKNNHVGFRVVRPAP